MKFRVKHRKLFYVPGMISLVMLPLLLLSYFYLTDSFKGESSIEIGLPSEEDLAIMKQKYPFVFQRKCNEFTLNGSLETDKANLVRFQQALRQHNKIKDTVGGIKLHFGKQMQYEVFIRVLDILTIEGTPTYMPYKNQMLIVNASPSEIKKYFAEERRENTPPPCGNPAIEARQREIEREKERLAAYKNHEESFLKKHWYLFMAFFGIILLNGYVLIKFNKNRFYNQKSYI